MTIRLTALFFLLATVVATGCSGSGGRARVSGKVYVGDQPMTAGDIHFHGPNKTSGSGPIQADGSYTVTDAPLGDCKITVLPKPFMPGRSAPPKDIAPINTGGTSGNPAKSPRVPDRYQKPESTDLTFTVKSGSNNHEVKLGR